MYKKITESSSLYNNLETKSTLDLLTEINAEDAKISDAIKLIIPQIELFVDELTKRMKLGGRLFYIGSGTSGRLGIIDASECPPTFGVPFDMVIGIIAGGDSAIRKAVESAEDDKLQGWKDLKTYHIEYPDTVVGIAASGTTPYVLGALDKCNNNNILSAGITCNPGSPLDNIATHSLVPIVGPEYVTGSTRMKSGTAQKLILNMISTSVMIKLGRVFGNKMIDMKLSNNKLIDRGTKMIMAELNIDYNSANKLLLKHNSVREAIKHKNSNNR